MHRRRAFGRWDEPATQDGETIRPLRIRILSLVLAHLVLTPLVLAVAGALIPPGLAPDADSDLDVAVVDHPTRARIIAYLEAVPGDYFRSIVRGVRVSVGETRHHLNILIRRGRVREERQRRRSRYYLNSAAAEERNATFRMVWAMRDNRIRVFRVVQQAGPVRPSDVAAAIGVSRQLAAYHLKRLATSGQVRHERGIYRL